MDESLLARLSELEARLHTIDDERAIVRRMHEYAHALDYAKNSDDFVNCFTEDGVWYSTIESTHAGSEGVRLSGREELRAWAGASTTRGTPGHFTKHMLVEPAITIDGDRADATSYFSVFNETPNGPIIYSMGRYLDKLVRCEDGEWRFIERHLLRENVDARGQTRPAG